MTSSTFSSLASKLDLNKISLALLYEQTLILCDALFVFMVIDCTANGSFGNMYYWVGSLLSTD